MLERYIDVTKSQLFYAKAVLMVEGISEELLVAAFAQVMGFRLEEYDIELVQTGTSFLPFMLLFNSTDEGKRLIKRVAVATDDDRFTDSKKKEYNFSELIKDDYALLQALHESIEGGTVCSRIANLEHMKNGKDSIEICKALKTLEYEIALSNIPKRKAEFEGNILVKYLREGRESEFVHIDTYLNKFGENLDEPTRKKVAILLWKLMPVKSVFAQDFAAYLVENLDDAKKNFSVPCYILAAFKQLRG